MKKNCNIIWDWNGTLLDDVEICLESINTLLGRRKIPLLDKATYKAIFRFPVEEYYMDAGFNFTAEPFALLANEFIYLYHSRLPEARLFHQAKETIGQLSDMGCKHFLVSAMEHEALLASLQDRDIQRCFAGIKGIQDHYAKGKTGSARLLIAGYKLDVTDTCLIGDTDHDFEVAQELGCGCILISRGHQSEDRLNRLDCPVLDNLAELPSFFLNSKRIRPPHQ